MLSDIVSAAAGYRRVSATGWLQEGATTRVLEIEIDRAAERWEVRDSVADLTYRQQEGQYSNGRETFPAAYGTHITLLPLKMLFPETLPVWGRPHDTDQLSSTERIGDGQLLTFSSIADPRWRKHAYLDDRLVLILQFQDFLQAGRLEIHQFEKE